MSKYWLIDHADIEGLSGLTGPQLKHARLLRQNRLSNLQKEARQIRAMRKEIEADIKRIDQLISINMPLVQFPAPTLPDKIPYERWPESEPAAKKRA